MSLPTFKAPNLGNIKTAPSFRPPDQNTCALKLFNKGNVHNISPRMIFSPGLRENKHA